jgi:hypothetical protein
MDLQEVKKQLPYGAIIEIAKRTKISQGLVSRIFNGQLANSPKEPEILHATTEYLAEYIAKKKKANEALNEVLKNI